MSKKAELKLEKETYRALRELAVLEGHETDEFVEELLKTYIEEKYGLHDLENISAKDLIRSLQVVDRLLGLMLSIAEKYSRLQPQMPAEQQAPPEIEELRGEISSIGAKFELLSKSIEELREIIAVKKTEQPQTPQTAGLGESSELVSMFRTMMQGLMRYMVMQMQAQMKKTLPVPQQ